MEPYLWVLVLAGLVSMDTTAGPQLLFSEPIVSCTLAGWLFGDIGLGVSLGILFQMLWIGYLPLGAARFTDNNLGSLVATASALGTAQLFRDPGTVGYACTIPTMLYGVLVSIGGMHARDRVRRMNGIRTEKFLDALDAGRDVSVTRVHLAGVAASFGKGVGLALVLIPVGILFLSFIPALPVSMTNALEDGARFIAGAAAASALLFYWKREWYALVSLGAIGGLAWTLMSN